MVEMAKKGDRYKCDLGLKDMNLQQEISSLVQLPNLPISFMKKLSRKALESGEITNEDVCASVFAY